MDITEINGLVLGKFMPPHLGHLFLIDTAIEKCDKVHIFVCSNELQVQVPGDIRVKTLRAIYHNNPKVIIHDFRDDRLPQNDSECSSLDEFYHQWVPMIYKEVPKLDIVFTSEDYGDDFAKYLGIQHYLVDKERKKFPISGTEIRTNPLLNWRFIPNEMKPFFVKRISVMGPESCGKSTLTEKLSHHYNTNFVDEYGRTLFEEKNGNLSIDDFILISKNRQIIEDDRIKTSNKILFSDTEDITTYIFSKMYHPDSYKSVEKYFEDKIGSSKKYDLYILLRSDCPAIQDGTRQFLDGRHEHYLEIRKCLDKYGCNYIEVGGDWENRYNISIYEIDEFLDIKS